MTDTGAGDAPANDAPQGRAAITGAGAGGPASGSRAPEVALAAEVASAPDATPAAEVVPAPDSTPAPRSAPAPEVAPALGVTPAPDTNPELGVPLASDATPAPDSTPVPDVAPVPDATLAPDSLPAPEVAPALPAPEVAPAPPAPVFPPSAATSGAPVIRTRGLTKRYRGGQLAVDGLDLTVPAGSVFGFLGPNGSGKTTTIRMLMGLIDPTSGTAEVLGRPMPEAARTVLPEVGALIEGPALYGFLNGRDNLLRYDRADPTADPRTRRARVGTALERVGLAAASGKKAKAYSLGMKQRLGLAAALLRPRRLLVLDEPTNGLDPQGMREIRLLVRELAAEGTTVFLSSHLLDEIEQVCTHAAVMARGRLIVQGPVADLAANARGRLAVTTPDPGDAARILQGHGLTGLSTDGDRLTADAPPAAVDLADLNAALVGGGVRVRFFGVERGSLEDAFVALTGEGFDVAG
ncbi:hypothetical protein GCM10027028_09890 [Streptomyces sundarbansensis]